MLHRVFKGTALGILIIFLILFVSACKPKDEDTPLDPVIENSSLIFNQLDENEITFSIDLKGGTFSEITGNGITSSDYTFSDNSLTIQLSYLNTLEVGSYTFTFTTNDGDVTFTIQIVDGVVHPTISFVSGNFFSLGDNSDLELTIDLKGSLFVGVQRSGVSLSSSNYTLTGNALSIKASYLNQLSTVGAYQFKLISSTGFVDFTIQVVDGIIHPSYTFVTNNIFNLGDTSNLELNIDLKGSEFVGVQKSGVNLSASNYTQTETTLSIKASYLNTLSTLGNHQFTLISSTGSVDFTILINDRPTATDKEMIKFPTESFINEPLVSFVTNTFGTITYQFTLPDMTGIGTLTHNNSTGTFSFTPVSGFIGEFVFIYTVTDQYGAVSNEAEVNIIYKIVDPIIFDSNKSFDKGTPADVIFSVNLKGIESSAPDLDFVSILKDGTQLSGSHYVFEKTQNRFQMKASYLSTLSYGLHSFTLVTEGGTGTFTLEITDSRTPQISPLEASYVKGDLVDLTFSLNLLGAESLSIKKNEEVIAPSSYTIENSNIIFHYEYLETLPEVIHQFKLITEFGEKTFTISVVLNTEPPVLITDEILIQKTGVIEDQTILGDYLTVSTLFYKLKSSETYAQINISDYLVEEAEILLKSSFSQSLNAGIYDLKVENPYGFDTLDLIINDKPISTDKEMIKLPNEIFSNESLSNYVTNSMGSVSYEYTVPDITAYGVLTTNANGTFSFTPVTGWHGQFTFTYHVIDSYNLSSDESDVTIIYKEVKPFFSTSSYQFNKNGGSNLSISYDSKGNPQEWMSYPYSKLMFGEVELILNTDFTLVGESILLLASTHLSVLDYGAYTYTLFTQGGSNTFEVVVMDSREVSAIDTEKVYLQSEPAVIQFTLELFDKTLQSVTRVGGSVLSAGSDYIIIDQTLTFTTIYLATLSAIDHQFLLNNQNTITILVKTDNDVSVNESSKETILNKDVTITTDLNILVSLAELEASTTLSGHGITSSDYDVSLNQVTLHGSFLNSLTYGVYTFTIDNGSSHSDTFTVILGGKPIETSHPDGQLITKFTNEVISNEPFRVQSRVGLLESYMVIDSSEITPLVGSLSFNQSANQFTFIRNVDWWGVIHFSYQATDEFGFTSETITMTIEFKPLNPTISDKDLKVFYKANGVSVESDIVYTISNMQQLLFNKVTGHGIVPTDYGFSGQFLTINSSYLITLDYGTYVFTFYTTGGMETFTIFVKDNLPTSTTSTNLNLQKLDLVDLAIDLNLYGNPFQSVNLNSTLLVLNSDYTFSENILTINSVNFGGLPYGNSTLTISNGVSPLVLDVWIHDDLNPTIIAEPDHHILYSTVPYLISLNTYGNSLLVLSGNGITVSDYSILGNTVTISTTYLDTLLEGAYQFVLTSGYGLFEGSLEITVNIDFVPVEAVVTNQVTIYDIETMNDLTYLVDLNDYQFTYVSGHGIQASDYTFIDGTLTIQKSYLKYFDEVGTYEFVLVTTRDLSIVESILEFNISWLSSDYKVINGGFETGDLFGWNGYAFWKDEYGMVSFIEERIVETSFYGSAGTNPYNKDGVYHLGVYAEPYSSTNKDLNQERMGMLRSSDFILGGSGWISFKLGGGQNTATAYVSVKEAGTNIEIARFGNRHFNNTTLSGTVNAEAYMFQYYFDLSAHLGKTVYFLIVDAAGHEWSVLSADSFNSYYEAAPTPNANQLAYDIKPVIYHAGLATNQMISTLTSNIDNWENPNSILQWTDSRARTNANSGDAALGAMRSPAFTIDGSNTYLRWNWEGDIQKDKQLFLSIKEVGTNIEVLRLVRRENLNTKSGGGLDKHWYNLAGLDITKEYYLEFIDNHRGSWGLISIQNVDLLNSAHADVQVSGDQAVNTYYGLSIVSTVDGKHRMPNESFDYIPTTYVYNVITTLPENPATGMNVMYHSKYAGTLLEYTTADDTDFSEKLIITPTVELFDLAGFSSRYICSVNITNLLPDTSYIYRITSKNNATPTYQLITASLSGSLSIAYFSDSQSLTLSQAKLNQIMLDKALLHNPDISMGLMTGDIVELGGNEPYWDYFFEATTSLSQLPLATVPGNHDYYVSDGILTNNNYYNAFFNNPKNGTAEYQNSSYYFITNNTLFIMLDAVSSNYGSSQIDWFESVIENNPTEFIIVSTHYSPYGGHHETTSSEMRSIWAPVFDAYNVDLVLSGHDHIYTRTPRMLNDEVSLNANLGTTYLSGGSSGHKQYTVTPGTEGDYAFYSTVAQSIISIITINNHQITVTAINMSGAVVDTFALNAKTRN
jgi:hypothetical protein